MDPCWKTTNWPGGDVPPKSGHILVAVPPYCKYTVTGLSASAICIMSGELLTSCSQKKGKPLISPFFVLLHLLNFPLSFLFKTLKMFLSVSCRKLLKGSTCLSDRAQTQSGVWSSFPALFLATCQGVQVAHVVIRLHFQFRQTCYPQQWHRHCWSMKIWAQFNCTLNTSARPMCMLNKSMHMQDTRARAARVWWGEGKNNPS